MPLSVTFIGVSYSLLSLMAATSAILAAIFHSQGRIPNDLLRFLDVPYGIIMAGFDRTLGIPLFFLYFMGAQAIVPGALIVLNILLIRRNNWARQTLIYFSSLTFVVMMLELGSSKPRFLAAVIALIFHGIFILYFTRSGIKKHFK